jgi:hypothetical protein
MEKSDIQGTTALRPMKTPRTSTTGSGSKTIMGGTTIPAYKEVIQTSTQISIQINPP